MPLKRDIVSEDLYAKLGVQSGASREEIRASYKELAIKWHPDKAGDTEQNKAEFRAVQEAWEVLGDESSRKEYDRARASKRPRLDDFVRGTYPEDPFKKPGQSSTQPPQSGTGGGDRRSGIPILFSGTFISTGINHMYERVRELERDLRASFDRYFACEPKLRAEYQRRPTVTIKLRNWHKRLTQTKLAYPRFLRRLEQLKAMLPPVAEARVTPSVMTILPNDIARFSVVVFRVTLATLTICQLAEEFVKGEDIEVYLDVQLSIIQHPDM